MRKIEAEQARTLKEGRRTKSEVLGLKPVGQNLFQIECCSKGLVLWKVVVFFSWGLIMVVTIS